MTRSRASAPALAAALLALLALVAAACGSAAPTGGQTTAPGSSGPVASGAPTASLSGSPSVTPTPGTSGSPAATPTPSSSDGPSPSSSAGAASADACSGTDNNRTFYLKFSQAVTWTVFCPVLPKGWFVTSGGYRLANGGKLEIAYTGPGGASIAWSEGAFCAGSDGCVPSGADAGGATLGTMAGTIVALDDGGWAVVASRALNPEWLVVAHGMDQPATEAIAAAMAQVSP